MNYIHRECIINMSGPKCKSLIQNLSRTRGCITSSFTHHAGDFPDLTHCSMIFALKWQTQEQCDRFAELTGFDLKEFGPIRVNSQEGDR